MAQHQFAHDAVYVTHCLTSLLSDDAIRATVLQLSPEEEHRRQRFHFERDRRDFAVAHALKRRSLSLHGDRGRDAWTFATAASGKPVLASEDASRTQLVFNLSHTAGLVACAVGHNVDVGVDVEWIDRGVNVTELAERFFEATEASALGRLGEYDRPTRFIEVWTLKEAFVKAIGEGLSCPLDTFSFTFGDMGSLRFSCARPARARLWYFSLYAPSPNHRMAIAIGTDAADPPTVHVEPALSPLRTGVGDGQRR